MQKMWIAALVVFVTLPTPSWAMDQIYGAGTLPKLTYSAQVVVEVKEATIASENGKRIVFAITPMKPWKGAPMEGPLFVICPTTEEAPGASDLNDAAVFLRGPLDERQRQFWEIAEDMQVVYQFVNGPRGVVSLRQPLAARRHALATYLLAADQPDPEKARLIWAKKNVRNSDLFLQESALFELERQTDKAGVLATLSDTISSAVPTTAAQAVTIVGDSASNDALEVLVGAAANKALQPLIRRQAVIELLDRPDAAARLQVLIDKDPFVAAAVKQLREPEVSSDGK
jgi:hypothetical protein